MANSITLKTSELEGRYMSVTCTQTRDIATNTSTINWTLSVLGGAVNYYDTGPTKLVIGGVQVYYKERVTWETRAFPAGKGSVSGTLKVTHGTNGAASINVSLSTSFYTTTTRSVSDTWVLDTIPRGATLLTATDFNDEGNPTITYSNPAGSSVDKLQICLNIDNNTIVYKNIDKDKTSYTFSLTDSERVALRKAVTGSNSKTISFFITTTIGSTTFYSSIINKTFTVINATPTLSPTVVDTGYTSAQLTGNPNKMIRYFNSMEYSIGAQARKEATIVSQSVTCGGITSTQSSGVLGTVSSNVFVFSVTDSRNNTVTKTIEVPMVDYVPLTCDIDGKINLNSDDGTKATITFTVSGNYFNGSFGAVANTLELSYSIEDSSGGISLSPLTIPDNAFSGSTYSLTYTIPQELDYKNSYTIKVQAKDKIYDLESQSKTLKAIPVFDWGEEDFNFNVPVTINKIEIDYPIEQGVKNGWYYRKWNSGLAECWYTATVSGIDVGEFNLNGFYHSGSKGVNFPFTFTTVHYVNATGGSTGNMNIVRPFNNTNSQMTYIVVGMSDVSNATVRVNLEAKGTWKS